MRTQVLITFLIGSVLLGFGFLASRSFFENIPASKRGPKAIASWLASGIWGLFIFLKSGNSNASIGGAFLVFLGLAFIAVGFYQLISIQ
jgi:hypothetical protein